MIGSDRKRQVVSIAFIVAIFIAPLLALLFSIEAGLALMAIALTSCGFLLQSALVGAPKRKHPWLRAMVVLNILLAASCLVALALGLAN